MACGRVQEGKDSVLVKGQTTESWTMLSNECIQNKKIDFLLFLRGESQDEEGRHGKDWSA